MRFRQHQAQAHAQTARLFFWFGVLLIALTLSINLLLGLVFKLAFPVFNGYPALFFETNTAVILLFVLGGSFVETQRLRDGGGPRVAHWLGGREITDPDDGLERRLVNVVDEMAMASGQPTPRVYVLPQEDAINAFVAGWDASDTVLCVTQGALERLTRAELQGLVAHEFGHIKEGDLPLCMRLLALVWGLSLVHGYGQSLMARDEHGHARPLWLIGLVFAAIGWLGWVAGRLLQAAISRQREFLADASAIQFTRTRDGLGHVLRKVWHDQKVLAGQMHHPQADMIAALLMHGSGRANWLATHPSLPARIQRICGAVLPPLPAPLIRGDVQEPRRQFVPAVGAMPMQAHSASQPASIRAGHSSASPAESLQDPIAQAATQARYEQDREAWQRLQRLTGPTEQRLAILALMLDPANEKERAMWQRLAQGLSHAPRILEDVQALMPARRVPEFERLTDLVAQRPLQERRTLVETARDLLRVDGRVSPMDRLWWMALRHRVGVSGADRPHAMGALPTGAGNRHLQNLQETELRDIAAATAYLARLLPQPESIGQASPINKTWYTQVMARCAAPPGLLQSSASPDADALAHAIAGIQEMSWMLRPVLLRAWVEEALNHSHQGLLSDSTADALRLTAGLIDSPLPPVLESHYQPPSRPLPDPTGQATHSGAH